MDIIFQGLCKGCLSITYCFENSVCLRRSLSNEYDDDDNISEVCELNEPDDLTEDAMYSYNEGESETDS